MSIESVMPSNHLFLCHPLLFLPSIFPSIRVFFSKSVLYIRWPEYLSFSLSISSSREYSGLISFRVDRSGTTIHILYFRHMNRWATLNNHWPIFIGKLILKNHILIFFFISFMLWYRFLKILFFFFCKWGKGVLETSQSHTITECWNLHCNSHFSSLEMSLRVLV